MFADGFHTLNTELYDSHGTVHIPTKATVANLKSDSLGAVTILLVAGVPTLAKYYFRNLSPGRGLSLLKPMFEIHDEIKTASFHKFSF